jgi:hypothetical protein
MFKNNLKISSEGERILPFVGTMKSTCTPDPWMFVALASLGLTLSPGFMMGTLGFMGTAKAQAPVARSLKDSLTSRSSTAATGAAVAESDVGSISGGERFIRKRRRRTAFVGRDLNEMSSFVGEIQGSTDGNVRTATSSLRVRLQRNANLTTQRTNQTTRGIYEPPMAIGFTVDAVAPAILEVSLEKLLNDSLRIHHVGPLSVEVDARTATIAGVVASDEDRQLAEAYLRFEPSLSKVVNRLKIQPHPGKR